MARNKIYAIVEGNGEADPPTMDKKALPAVTVLIAKLLQDRQCWHLFPAKARPWRMRSCGDFFAPGKLEQAIRAHKEFPDCAAVLVLFDLDDGCPKEIAVAVADRIRAMEPLQFTVTVVSAKREYEAWFLASLESIHPGRTYAGDPEGLRAAKGWLEREFRYREVRDQARYTQALDITLAEPRSRSFRRLMHAIDEIITSADIDPPWVTPIPQP
jgi:hypothetical protein